MIPQSTDPILRAFLWLAVTILSFYVLYIGQDLIIPFVLAVFIWYLINVLSFAIMKLKIRGKGLPASLRYLASVMIIAAALGFLFNFINENVGEVIEVAPTYQQKILPIIDRINAILPVELPSVDEFVNQFNFGSIVRGLAGALTGIAGMAGIITIYVLFLFLEQRSFGPKIKGMMKGSIEENDVFKIIKQIDKDVRTYIGIKTLTSAATGGLSYGIMAAVNLDFAAFWGMLIFCLNFIPTIGSILATFFPSLLAIIAFENPIYIALVIGGITGVQILIGSFLEPKLMGSSLNLSPLVILLSLSLWGSLWGVPGMFLCVPITVIAMIVCSHFEQTRPIAVFLSGDGKIKQLN